PDPLAEADAPGLQRDPQQDGSRGLGAAAPPRLAGQDPVAVDRAEARPGRLMSGRVYVIGAGLAGLSAAVRLAERGRQVVLIEGAGQAGGRCRSYVDVTLEMTIDNGNHLVLSGNHATYDYLRTLGTADRLAGPKNAVFDFCDVRDGRRWTIRP